MCPSRNSRKHVKAFTYIIALATAVMSCASKPGLATFKQQEFQALKEDIILYHNYSYFDQSKPWIFTGEAIRNLTRELPRTQCAKENLSKAQCLERLNQTVLEKLATTYFAIDLTSIQNQCTSDPLLCMDIPAVETLFRRLHNANVEKSRVEKLARLDAWREGKLTDNELKAALHLEFRLEKGELVVSLPAKPPLHAF